MMMLQAGRPDEINTTSLRDLLIAGGSLSWHYIESIRDLLPGTNVSVAYGQTEVAGMITYFKPNVRRDVILMMTKADSSGTAYPGFQYRVCPKFLPLPKNVSGILNLNIFGSKLMNSSNSSR